MFDKILVPLDGSPLSDRILTQLRRLLVRKDAAVSLVEVVAPGDLEREKVSGQLMESARKHLDSVAGPLRAGGARVDARVLVGDPAERILLHSLEDPPSLVAMATHGRSGIRRWTRGSVAERVLRGAKSPLLLVNPFTEEGKEARFKRILVPLDGSEEAASLLPLACGFARMYDATLVLHFATPVSITIDGVPQDFVTAADARRLLERFVPRLGGIPVELSTANGDPASTILDAVSEKKCDVIAMTTSAQTGLTRWILGSVAENVLRHAHCPILVQRA
jgi:nucleotide-binding universal stress UspA family protein